MWKVWNIGKGKVWKGMKRKDFKGGVEGGGRAESDLIFKHFYDDLSLFYALF